MPTRKQETEAAKATPAVSQDAADAVAAQFARQSKDTVVTTRKVNGTPSEGQVCLGACAKWKPLYEFGRTSKARGNKPMRRCRSCITAEAKARKAAATKDQPAEKPASKGSRKTAAKPAAKQGASTRRRRATDKDKAE